MAESLGLGLCGSVGLLSSLSSESASLHGVDTSGHIVDYESQLVLILRRGCAKGEGRVYCLRFSNASFIAEVNLTVSSVRRASTASTTASLVVRDGG